MQFYILKDIVSQSSYFKSRQNSVTSKGVGAENLKSWKTLRVEGSGWNLVEKLSTSPFYVIHITRKDLLSLGELGGGLILKN